METQAVQRLNGKTLIAIILIMALLIGMCGIIYMRYFVPQFELYLHAGTGWYIVKYYPDRILYCTVYKYVDRTTKNYLVRLSKEELAELQAILDRLPNPIVISIQYESGALIAELVLKDEYGFIPFRWKNPSSEAVLDFKIFMEDKLPFEIAY